MTPRTRTRRRRSSSRHGKSGTQGNLAALAALVTTSLLAVILLAGPLILGAARLWIELPLLATVAVLLLVQGLRLTSAPTAEAPRRADAIDLAVVLFVLYAIARWVTSPAAYFSRIEAMDIVGYAAVFFTCRYGMMNRKYCMLLIYALGALGAIETGFGYYLSNHPDFFPFGLTEKLQLHYAPRWVGTYSSPNNYASLLVMALATTLALGSFSKLAWPVRIILFYLAVMMIVGVTFSGSRGGWIALLAAIVALVIMGIRNGTVQWWIPVSGAALLLAVLGFIFSISPIARERLWDADQLFFGGKLANDTRVQLARDSLSIAHDHPAFGTGPGTFTFVHPRYQGSTFAFKAELVHDDYLNCLDDYGLVGFALALFFVAAVTLKFFRPLMVDNRWQDRVLVATGFAAWTALMVHSFVDFNLHIPANALLLFLLTGLALGRISDNRTRHWSTLPLSPLGRWLGGGIILLSLVYGLEVTRMALSDFAYETAFNREDVVPFSDSISGAQDAVRYDPGNAQALVFLGDLHRVEALRQKEGEARLGEGLKALEAYQKALRANTLDDSVEARIGMTLDVMQKYPEALAHYQQALADQPYNAQFWFWLGNHYTDSGETDKAQEAYTMAAHLPGGSANGGRSETPQRTVPVKDEVQQPSPVIDSPAAPPAAPVSPH